jgi:hypothetical protein
MNQSSPILDQMQDIQTTIYNEANHFTQIHKVTIASTIVKARKGEEILKMNSII